MEGVKFLLATGKPTDSLLRILPPFREDAQITGRVIRKPPSGKGKSLMDFSFEQFKKTLPRRPQPRRTFVIYDEILTGGIIARGNSDKVPWKEEGF